MKKICIAFCFFILVNNTFSQTLSTQGKEFWVSFMNNHNETIDLDLKLIISAKRACNGTIRNINTGWNTVFTVTANGITNITIPIFQVYDTASEQIGNKGLIVTSTDTISLYASNFYDASFDATNVLPTTALLDEYMIQAYYPNLMGSEMLIVATENNTIIDITPKTETKHGKKANIPFSVTLNRGQTYQVITIKDSLGFSGSRVKARDCKKIAVFNGNNCALVPSDCFACDHVVEQTFPVVYWGKKFAITSSFGRDFDRICITALNNNTQIKKDGFIITTINSGETYEFEITSFDESCFIETSGPCAINQYFVGKTCGGSDLGDPSMVWISPIEQQINEITFGTFQTQRTTSHYVNIVTATNDIASMTLDGNSISGRFNVLSGNTNLSFARILVSYGTHTLKSKSGFIAYVYGYGDFESYGYSVGSRAVNLSKQMKINDIPNSILPVLPQYCINKSINFEPMVNFTYDGITWLFGDGKSVTGNKVTHTYDSYGAFQVQMIIKRKGLICTGILYDTVSVKLQIKQYEKIFRDTIKSGDVYNKNGFKFTAFRDTIITKTYINPIGCDSNVILYLKVLAATSSTTKIGICTTSLPFQWNGNSYTAAGTYVVHLINGAGCDSAATLILSVDEASLIIDPLSICVGSSISIIPTGNCIAFKWSDGLGNGSSIIVNPVSSTTYFVTGTNSSGCSAIAQAVVKVNPLPSVITNASESLVCYGSSVTLSAIASGGTYPFTYSWSSETVSSANPVSSTIVNAKSNYSVTVTDITSCSASGSIIIDIYPVTEINTVGSSICKGNDATISASGGLTYTWSDGLGFGFEKTVNPSSTTTFTVTATDQYNCSFSAQAVVTVIVIDKAPEIDQVVICPNGPKDAVCQVYQPNPTYEYSWFKTKDGVLPIFKGVTYTIMNVAANDTLYVEATKIPEGCKSLSRGLAIVSIGTLPEPRFTFEPSDIKNYIEVKFSNLSISHTGNDKIRSLWYFGNEGTSYLHDPVYIFQDTGDYKIQLVVINSDECRDTISQHVYVTQFLRPWLPDAFTPNGNNTNDILYVRGQIKTFNLIIYNQWGYKVFESSDQQTGWDGKYNGVEQPEGNYAYILQGVDLSGKNFKIGGVIILIR